LHYTAFPWFKEIADWKEENQRLELTKNSTNKGNASAKNEQKSIWWNTAHKVRTSMLQYWEKIYLPEFH
jgi:hypothetical protein